MKVQQVGHSTDSQTILGRVDAVTSTSDQLIILQRERIVPALQPQNQILKRRFQFFKKEKNEEEFALALENHLEIEYQPSKQNVKYQAETNYKIYSLHSCDLNKHILVIVIGDSFLARSEWKLEFYEFHTGKLLAVSWTPRRSLLLKHSFVIWYQQFLIDADLRVCHLKPNNSNETSSFPYTVEWSNGLYSDHTLRHNIFNIDERFIFVNQFDSHIKTKTEKREFFTWDKESLAFHKIDLKLNSGRFRKRTEGVVVSAFGTHSKFVTISKTGAGSNDLENFPRTAFVWDKQGQAEKEISVEAASSLFLWNGQLAELCKNKLILHSLCNDASIECTIKGSHPYVWNQRLIMFEEKFTEVFIYHSMCQYSQTDMKYPLGTQRDYCGLFF